MDRKSRDHRVRIRNVKRMCRRHGTYLGRGQATRTEWWVVDGLVWALDSNSACRWGDYFEWCKQRRAGQIDVTLATTTATN